MLDLIQMHLDRPASDERWTNIQTLVSPEMLQWFRDRKLKVLAKYAYNPNSDLQC